MFQPLSADPIGVRFAEQRLTATIEVGAVEEGGAGELGDAELGIAEVRLDRGADPVDEDRSSADTFVAFECSSTRASALKRSRSRRGLR